MTAFGKSCVVFWYFWLCIYISTFIKWGTMWGRERKFACAKWMFLHNKVVLEGNFTLSTINCHAHGQNIWCLSCSASSTQRSNRFSFSRKVPLSSEFVKVTLHFCIVDRWLYWLDNTHTSTHTHAHARDTALELFYKIVCAKTHGWLKCSARGRINEMHGCEHISYSRGGCSKMSVFDVVGPDWTSLNPSWSWTKLDLVGPRFCPERSSRNRHHFENEEWSLNSQKTNPKVKFPKS